MLELVRKWVISRGHEIEICIPATFLDAPHSNSVIWRFSSDKFPTQNSYALKMMPRPVEVWKFRHGVLPCQMRKPVWATFCWEMPSQQMISSHLLMFLWWRLESFLVMFFLKFWHCFCWSTNCRWWCRQKIWKKFWTSTVYEHICNNMFLICIYIHMMPERSDHQIWPASAQENSLEDDEAAIDPAAGTRYQLALQVLLGEKRFGHADNRSCHED